MELDELSFDANGLLPAIVQDERTGNVLMLGYVNREAIAKTLETKETWFYSRSRQELWNKGATSGHRQKVKRVQYDCDADTLLIQVQPLGPACHLGKKSCFSSTLYEEQTSVREVVYEIVDELKGRRAKPVEGSYTSYLFREGIDKVLKKVGEEATEVVIGAKNQNHEELTNELADLTYHCLVLMELLGVSLEDVKTVLRERRPKKEVPKID